MQKIIILLIAVLITGGCIFTPKSKTPITIIAMKLESLVFTHDQFLPTKYTCDGTSINPSFKISEVPNNAKSLVLIVDDPDAPSGDFVHWLLWNIDPKTTTIEEDSVPTGATQGTNSENEAKYTAPCPPTGVHHYNFKIYALDTKLNLPSSTDKTGLLSAMQGHIVNGTTMIGLYNKK